MREQKAQQNTAKTTEAAAPAVLTARQQAILDFIRSHFMETSFWPSIREIQQRFGYRSTNSVMGHLKALENKGALRRIAGQARAFCLAEKHAIPGGTAGSVRIPVYGSIAAGYPDGVETAGAIDYLQVDPRMAGNTDISRLFALRVRGESMINAGIHDGDIVVLEQRAPQNGDIVAALMDNETTLKRFVQEGQNCQLKAENPTWPDLRPAESMSIQGVARAVIRKIPVSLS